MVSFWKLSEGWKSFRHFDRQMKFRFGEFQAFSYLPFGYFAEYRAIELSLDAGKLRATWMDEGMDSYEDKALLV